MRAWLLLVLGIGVICVGCRSSDSSRAQAAGKPAVDNVGVAAEAAGALVADFQKNLRSELLAAMNAGGAAEAIGVCNIRAPEIMAAHSQAGVWAIARVTDKPRVPEHRATEQQMAILQKFRDTASTQEYFSEWQVDRSGDSVFAYYAPIRMGEVCTNCHGNQDKLAQGVLERLAELYPHDKAIGYETGDLRGLFVVTMNWPEALEPARKLIDSAEMPGDAE